MDAKQACGAFDAANEGAAVAHREATRLVSCSQVGSGAAHTRPADLSVAGSIIGSTNFLLLIQRRLGLYLSALAGPLHALAVRRGDQPSQYQLLGDQYLNAANNSSRHKVTLAAIGTMLRAVTPAVDDGARVILCDRGDGTRLGKEEARTRYAHLNATHVPDAARLTIPPTLYELKGFTCYNQSVALGHGSAGRGGAPSTAEGHLVAFGGTLEDQTAVTLGLKQIGSPDAPCQTHRPFNRHTGAGYVAVRDGNYRDAIAKKHPTHLLLVETTGALSPPLARIIERLAAQSREKGAIDHTAYGLERRSPKEFATHHIAAISAAIQLADVLTLRNTAR